MSAFRIFSGLFATMLLVALAAGCCKKQESTLLQIEFTTYDFSVLDSVLLIETARGNFADTLDTTYKNLERNHFVNIPIYWDEFHNHNYIIYNDSPYFQHRIENIEAFYAEDGCGEIMFSFTIDGDNYAPEQSHRLVIDTNGVLIP